MAPPRPGSDTAPPRGAWLRIALRLGAVLAVAFAVSRGIDFVLSGATTIGAGGGVLMLGLLAAILAVYALLIAVPFVPGIEIGLTLIMLRGPPVAPFVYLATVAGLTLAFLVGRHVRPGWLHRLLIDLRLRRLAALVDEIAPLSQRRRLALFRAWLPGRLGALVVNFRYVALALLVNLPGSALIGGGGGIALTAGLSGMFTTRWTLVTFALAVAPVPLAVWIFGPAVLALLARPS